MTTINRTKQVLIVSDSTDETAKQIKQWLVSLGIKIISLNPFKQIIKIIAYSPNNGSYSLIINGEVYQSSDFDHIYFIRGSLTVDGMLGISENREGFSDINNAFLHYMSGYEVVLKELTKNLFHTQSTFGKDNGGRINKLEMLRIAKNAGFDIPNTLVTSQKRELLVFYREVSNVITKNLNSGIFFYDKKREKLMHTLTVKLTSEDLCNLPETFPLSLFQENVEKFVELRVFYIGDEIFPAAIFSQNANNTQQDYRNYDYDNPNRVVPFMLPVNIIKKIKKFQCLSGLKTGSIDLILTFGGDYVFLEINPQRQFMGISKYCNFKLDKIVAQQFI